MNIILFDSLSYENALSINDERAFHILNVLKLKSGDTFKCGVYNGSKGIGTLTKITGTEIFFEYTAAAIEPQNAINLTIILGAVRPICLKRIVRSASECGVKRIILAGTELSEKSYLESGFIKNGEVLKTIKDGAMQSGETSLLNLEIVPSLKTALGLINIPSVKNETKDNMANDIAKKLHSLFILDNKTEFYRTEVPFLQDEKIKSDEAVLAIGSERGWTDNERRLFIDAGFLPRKLSSRILRTETATEVAMFPFLK